MKAIRILTILIVLPFLICCTTENGQVQGKEHKEQDQVLGEATAKQLSKHLTDEQEFRMLFENLKNNLKKKDLNNVASLLNFPFYTSHKEVSNGVGVPIDPISLAEFNTYKSAIFNADVLRVLPLCKEDNLSEIDEKTDEVYYQSLKKLTDSGSKMYEVYMQYPETSTQAESYFSFIFGRVNGKFKMLSTYAKWPVK
ncbi:hypothetical protein [Pedobacter sp. N23S346]|uniref:hypothetical protein n=1 Tax=Pedobacter sp. N23S346 TaxID=3402750 RepID=UPI003ACC1136